MISTVDVLNLGATFSILVAGVCMAVITYRVVTLLGSVKKIVDQVESTTRDVQALKDSVKLLVMGIGHKVLERFPSEGGAKRTHGTKKDE